MERSEMYCDWSKIDLKVFFAILTLMNPEVKQADVAKDLGITPATLSRIINGTYGDGKIRDEWIPALKPYLMSLDTQTFSKKWNAIECLHDCYAGQERHELVHQIITAGKGTTWTYNDNWVKPNSILYYGDNGQIWFMYDILDRGHPAQQIKEIAERYKGYINFESPTYFSFLCYNEETFDKTEDYLITILADSYLAKKGIMFSAIWVDVKEKNFKREYRLYNDK